MTANCERQRTPMSDHAEQKVPQMAKVLPRADR